MKKVLDSIGAVIGDFRYVKINQDTLNKFSETIKDEDLAVSENSSETVLSNSSENQHIAFIIIFNSINFSYWGDPKWSVEINGKTYDDWLALILSLKQSIENNYPLLDTKYLSTIPEKDLELILKGDTQIPLFQERLNILRALGKEVKNKFNGSFEDIIKKSDYETEKLVKTLTSKLPIIFNDNAIYNSHEVYFWKRAQLIPHHLSELSNMKLLSFKLQNLYKTTAFADYIVPQVLRQLGILEYSSELSEKVDNLIELPNGSIEEVEIRASTVWAIEILTKILKKRFKETTASKADTLVWLRGMDKNFNGKPHHRTRSIWY